MEADTQVQSNITFKEPDLSSAQTTPQSFNPIFLSLTFQKDTVAGPIITFILKLLLINMLFSKLALVAFTIAAGVEAGKSKSKSKTTKTTKATAKHTTLQTATAAASTAAPTAAGTAAATSATPAETGSSGGGSSGGLQTVLPAASGTTNLKAAQTIAAGASFDGKMFLFDRAGEFDNVPVRA